MNNSSRFSWKGTWVALLLPVAGLAACGDKEEAAVQTTTADGSLSSPSSEMAEKRDVSMVRMINALPNMSQATVSVDDRALFSGVNYKAVTPYSELDNTFARFRVVGGGRDTTIASNNEILIDGSRYTVVALPENDGGVRLRVLKDELATETGKARLRVIHGVQGAGEVDVLMQGNTDPIFDDVNPTTEAGFRDVDPVSTTLIVRTSDNGRQLFRKEMRLEAGHAYTVVLSGTSGQRVEAIVIDDRMLDGDVTGTMDGTHDAMRKTP